MKLELVCCLPMTDRAKGSGLALGMGGATTYLELDALHLCVHLKTLPYIFRGGNISRVSGIVYPIVRRIFGHIIYQITKYIDELPMPIETAFGKRVKHSSLP